MSEGSELENPFGLLFWIINFILIIIEALFVYLVFTYIENTKTRTIVLVSVTIILVSLFILISIRNQRKKGIIKLYDERKKIKKNERFAIYKIGKKYEISKNALLNRVGINRQGEVISINLSRLDISRLPFAVRNLKNISKLICKESTIKNTKKLYKRFKKVEIIEFKKTVVKDLKEITIMKNLQKLSMIECGIKDLTGIEGLYELKELNLLRNEVSKIDQLSNLKKLRIFQLSYNKIENIESLEHLNNLRSVYLALNPVRDFSPIIRETLEDISFSVMYKAYSEKDMSAAELMKIKDDWMRQFEEIRGSRKFNRTAQSGPEEYGFTVELHGGWI